MYFRAMEGVEGSEAKRLRVVVHVWTAEWWWATVCAADGRRNERAFPEATAGGVTFKGRERRSHGVGN